MIDATVVAVKMLGQARLGRTGHLDVERIYRLHVQVIALLAGITQMMMVVATAAAVAVRRMMMVIVVMVMVVVIAV